MQSRKFLAPFLFLMAFGILVVPAIAEGSWEVTTVDDNIVYYPFESFVYDKNSTPHIAYRINTTASIWHAWKSGGYWTKEKISRSHGTFSTSIALGPDGNPAISYGDGIYFGNLMYASKKEGSWTTTIVARGSWADAGQFSSLAFDHKGVPHITYNDGQILASLYYATLNQTTGNWEFSLVDDDEPYTGDAGYSSSLTFDTLNHPHIAYISDDPWGLRYATLPEGSSNWSVTKLDELSKRNYFSRTYTGASLALDLRGFPHIAYFNQTTSDASPALIWHMFWNGTAWNRELVTELNKRDLWTSLVIDAKNVPHISYCDRANKALKYATRSAAGIWTSQTVVNGTLLREPALALDPTGRPGIVYYDLSNHTLNFAQWIR